MLCPIEHSDGNPYRLIGVFHAEWSCTSRNAHTTRRDAIVECESSTKPGVYCGFGACKECYDKLENNKEDQWTG